MENQMNQATPEEPKSQLSKLINRHCFVMDNVVQGCCSVIKSVLEKSEINHISTEGFNQFGAESPLPEQNKMFIVANAVILSREIYNKIIDRAEKMTELD